MSIMMRKVGLKTKGFDADAADETLREERQTYTRDGEKVPGFTSSVVPTLEEKVVAEHIGQKNADGHSRSRSSSSSSSRQHNGDVNGSAKATDGSASAQSNGDARPSAQHRRTSSDLRTADGELFGTPAHGDTRHDAKVPGPGDADSEEERAVVARVMLRRSLNSKPTGKTWTLPTPTPHVDPHGFEDPISDQFWNDMWLAGAVHNVSRVGKNYPENGTNNLRILRPRYTAECSMLCQMTSSRRGSSTRNSSCITND